MDLQLATPEINAVRQILQDYDPAQQALDTLEKHNGSFDISFDQLWTEKWCSGNARG